MNRNAQTSGPRIRRDSTYSGHEVQNKKVVTTSIVHFDYAATARPAGDRGNIVATPRPPSGAALRYSQLLERRSTKRISTVLAGLIATATISPAAATTPAPQIATQDSNPPAPSAVPEQVWVSEAGTASWYGQRHHGRRTASGTRFDQNAMTAAHPWLPMGTKVRVTRRDNGQSITVTITDRLPTKKHVIDLSYGAAQRLGIVRAGIAEVDLDPA